MKSLRMKIAAGSRPPVSTRIDAELRVHQVELDISWKIGTIAAVPVITEDSSSSR